MLFLFDILPDSGHVRFTLELAFLLDKSGHEVYYTDSSDSVFTSILLKRRIGRIIYPGDFRWFIPDLVLLDYHLQGRVDFYRRHAIPLVFVAILGLSRLDEKNTIPIVYLPPSEDIVSSSSLRLNSLLKVLSSRENTLSRVVIAGLLDEKDGSCKLLPFYEVIKQSCIANIHFQTFLLSNSKEAVKQLFPLPDNMAVYRSLDLPVLLPHCDVALTTGNLNILIENIYANLPSLAYPVDTQTESYKNVLQRVGLGISLYGEMKKITPEIFGQQIADILVHKVEMKEKIKQLRDFFEAENQNLAKTIEYLISFIQQNKK